MADVDYTIGLGVTGADEVDSAAKSADELDKDLASLSEEARAVAKATGKTAAEAKKLAREFEGADRAALVAADHFGDLDSIFASFGGPIGTTVARVFELREAFTKLSLFTSKGTAIFSLAAIGITAVALAAAAAVAIFAIAAAALVVSLAKASISAADAAIKVGVLREAMTGSASGAAALSSTIKAVAGAVPLAESEVAGLADTLWKAGKRGKALEDALLAASYEAAGLGKNPGPELLTKRMANLDVIGVKFGDHLRDILAGPSTVDATGKFGRALAGFVDLFGQNRSEGRALQKLLSVIVDPLVTGLTKSIPLATTLFRGMIIGALNVAIAIVTVAKALGLMDTKQAEEEWLTLEDVMLAGEIAAYALAVVLGIVALALIAIAVVLAAVIVSAVLFVAFFVAIPAAIIGAVLAVIAAVAYMAYQVDAYLVGLAESGYAAAEDMAAGLVAGIRNGTGAVVEAIRAMAGSAVAAIKAALKIASPSKIFEDLGAFTGEGFAIGVEDETGNVQTSLERMVTPPSIDAPGSSQQSASAGGGSPGAGGINLTGVTLNFYGVRDAAEHGRDMLSDALTMLIEGDAAMVGAA